MPSGQGMHLQFCALTPADDSIAAAAADAMIENFIATETVQWRCCSCSLFEHMVLVILVKLHRWKAFRGKNISNLAITGRAGFQDLDSNQEDDAMVMKLLCS